MAMTLLKSITNLRYTSRISVLFCSINISVVPLRVSRYLWLCIGTILGLLLQQDVRSTKIMEKMRAFFLGILSHWFVKSSGTCKHFPAYFCSTTSTTDLCHPSFCTASSRSSSGSWLDAPAAEDSTTCSTAGPDS